MAEQLDKIDLSLDEIIKQTRKTKSKRGMPVNRMRGTMRGKKRGAGISPLNRTQQQAAQLKKMAIRGRGRGGGIASRGRVLTSRGRGRGGGFASRGRVMTTRGRGSVVTSRGGRGRGLASARVEVAVNRVQLAQEKLKEAKQRLFLEKQKMQRQDLFMTNRQVQPQHPRSARGRGARGRVGARGRGGPGGRGGRAGRLVRPSVDQYQNFTQKTFQRQNKSQMLSVRFSNIQQPQARISRGNSVRGGRGRGRGAGGVGRKVFF